MELNQIAYVFDYVTAAIEQNNLLADYDRLIESLTQVEGDDGSAEIVNALRADLVAKHQALEPVNWSSAQLVVLEKYGARPLLGDPVADALNMLFIDNFMNPEPICDYVAQVRVDSAELLAQIKQLQTDLAPLLNDLPLTGDPVMHGEILDANAMVHIQQPIGDSGTSGRMLETIKGAFNRGDDRASSGAIVPHQETPLSVKVAAALPVAIAVAGKAIDLYRVYNDNKSTALAPVPEKKQLPTSVRSTVNIRQTVHYTFSQTTVHIDNRKE